MTYIATFLLAALLTSVAVIDSRTLRIPNALNALLVVTGFIAAWQLDASLLDSAIGAVAGYGVLFAANLAYRSMRGRDGIGMGDAKLLAGAGAWLGWIGLPFVLLIGSTVGLAYVAALRIAGRTLRPGDALPFGPFLCAGTFVTWLVQTYT